MTLLRRDEMTTEARQHAFDVAVAALSGKATYTGASVTIGGWLLSSEFAVLFGMVLGTLGLIVNFYYKRKLTNEEIKLKREAADRDRIEHEHLMDMRERQMDLRERQLDKTPS